MKRSTYVPRHSVPGGAAKRAEPLYEVRMGSAGRGAILECDSPLLNDADVRAVFERICRAFPLRQEAALVAAVAASHEVRLHRLQAQQRKTVEERQAIYELTLSLGGCLIKLTTLYKKAFQ